MPSAFSGAAVMAADALIEVVDEGDRTWSIDRDVLTRMNHVLGVLDLSPRLRLPPAIWMWEVDRVAVDGSR